MDCPIDLINLTRLHDGIYMSDSFAASNLDVIVNFKITHIINATGDQNNNTWERIGLKYLTIKWLESPKQALFDSKDLIADKIVDFIDNSNKYGEGILIHSNKGKNRAFIAIIIYMMRK